MGRQAFRYFMVLVSAVQILFAIAFFWQWPLLTNIWPLEGTTSLTFILISSIAAAAAASTLWVALTGNFGAIAGIALDYVTIMVPASFLFFQLAGQTGVLAFTIAGGVCVFGAFFGAFLLFYGLRFPLDLHQPVPGLVKGSFAVFIIALLIVGGRLVFKMPNTIPWSLTAELSVVVGWMFLGAAAYFVYALLRPGWLNAAGQLCGFLAYDLVLIVPFIKRLPSTPPEQMPGMLIYTVVVIYSGLMAAYYLFVNKATRIFA